MDEITFPNKHQGFAKCNVHSHLFSLLLSVHPIPMYLNLALNLFSEIQITALLTLHIIEHFGGQEQDSLVLGFKNLASALSFQFNYDFSGENSFTNAAAIIIGVYFLLICLVACSLAVLYCFQLPYGRILAKAWSCFGSFHLTAVFLFIQYFALSLLKNLTQQDGLKDKFANEHEAVAMITIYMALNLIFGLITARFKTNKIKGNDIMATRTSWFAILGLMYKFALSLCLSQITNEKLQHWCDILCGVIFLSSRFYKFITDFPYYNSKTFKIFLTLAVFQQAQLGINTFWLLISIKREVSLTIVLYSYVIFGAILVHCSSSYLYHTVRKSAIKPTESLKSEKKFFQKMFAWERILEARIILTQEQRNEYGALFQHLVEKHATNCKINDCPCKYILFQKYQELGILQEKINMDPHRLNYELIKGLYEEGVKHISKNSLIKLQFANFLIHNDEHSVMNAIYLANSTKFKNTLFNLENDTLRTMTLNLIEEKIENTLKTQKTGLQTKQFVDYQIHKNLFRKKIAENTKLYRNFWTTYNQPNPIISHLLKLNININSQAEKLKTCWENLSLNYPRFCNKDYLINALYMQVIRNAPFTAEQLFERYFSFYKNELSRAKTEQKKEIFSSHQKDIVLCVSLNQANFAHVVFVSQNVHELGYHIEELKGSSAAKLMPLFFARKHSRFLLKEITENSLYTHLDKEISVFVREKSGYIRPATLYLTLFPYVKKGFYCLARIRLQETFDDYLFMLPNGKIEGGTQEISKRLNLDFNHNGNIGISDICLFGHRLLEFGKPGTETTEDIQVPESSRPSAAKIRNFSELIENQKTAIDDEGFSTRRKLNSSPTLKPSRFQIESQREIAAAAPAVIDKSLLEEDGTRVEEEGIRVKFFPFRNHGQERHHSFLVYLTHVSMITYDDHSLSIVRLTDTTATRSPKKTSKATFQSMNNTPAKESSIRKIFNFENVTAAKEETSVIDEEEEAAIPHESERDLEVITTMKSPRIDFPQIESPHSLVSQERLLSGESHRNQTKMNFSREVKGKEYHDNLRMERRKIVENFQPGSEGTSTTNRTNARETLVLMNVERAIHRNKMPVSYRLVKISVIGFILLSVVLFAYYQIEGNKKFDLLIENTNILEYSLTVLYYLNECTRTVTPVKLIDLEYIPRNRNGGGQFDLTLIRNFNYIVPNLTQANNKLRNSMSYFNTEQREKFYELIPVIQQDNLTINPEYNAFDVHAQLMSSALKLYVNLPTVPSNTDPDLNFIFNNTINDLLTHDEAIFTLLQEEDKHIVDGMANFVLVLLGIMLGTGVIVIVVLIRNEVNFIKKKMLFFDHFLRINEQDIYFVIHKSNRFYEALKEINFNEEDILYELQSHDNENSKALQTEGGRRSEKPHQFFIKKKKANFKSINKDSWVGVLTLIAFILWFWIAYSIFYNEFLAQSKSAQEYKSQVIQTSLFLSRFS